MPLNAIKDAVLGTSTIGDALARKKKQSPQYDFLWRIELPSLEEQNSVGALDGFLSEIIQGTNTQSDEINHRVMSVDTPFFQLDTKKVSNKNSFWYTASNNDIGALAITVHELEDGKTLQYFENWKSLIINEDGTYNPPAFYKRPIRFYRMSATKLDLHEYIYEGFFISEISTMNNVYDGNGITTYSISFTGDTLRYKFVDGDVVRGKVLAKEAEIFAKQWVNDKVRVSGGGLVDVLQTAGSL